MKLIVTLFVATTLILVLSFDWKGSSASTSAAPGRQRLVAEVNEQGTISLHGEVPVYEGSADEERRLAQPEVLAVRPATLPDAAPGRIFGRVVTPQQTGVPRIEVRAYHDTRGMQRATTTGDGSFEILGLPRGKLLGLRLDTATVPEGFVAPHQRITVQLNPGYPQNWRPASYYVELLEIPLQDGEREVKITLEREAVVTGRALRYDGTALPGVEVNLKAQPELSPRPPDASTETLQDGTFRLAVRTGQYNVQLSHWTSARDLDRNLGGILPFDLSISAGERRDLGDLIIGGGPVSLRGRVLDQDGEPVPELQVIAAYEPELLPNTPWTPGSSFLCWSVTDEQGSYQLFGLPRAAFTIYAGGNDYERGGTLGGKRLATHPDLLDVDLTQSETSVVLPDIHCRLSRPFTVTIHAHGKSPFALTGKRIWFKRESPDAPVEELDPPLRYRESQPRSIHLVGAEQTVTWQVPAPSPSIVVEIEDHGEILYSQVLVPIENGTFETEVTIP